MSNTETSTVDLVVVGSVGLDDIATPTAKCSEVLGGAAVYACAAASFFARSGMVAVAGDDFGADHRAALSHFGIDTEGLQFETGRTFRWSGKYDADFMNRRTLQTQLGVFADFEPIIPPRYRSAEFLLLGNIGPALQLRVLEQMNEGAFVAVDTMDLWINTSRRDLLEVVARSDLLTINDSEARLLTGRHLLPDCARELLSMGPEMVVIKKGEHGSMLFLGGEMFILAAYPVASLTDPTGAGDTFAGACLGYMAECGRRDCETLLEGLQYGSVVASFAVESFGLESLRDLNRVDVERRRESLRKMVRA